MTGSVSNPNMHYGTTDIGILNPPDKLPKSTVYSYTEGQRMYNEMQHDLYVNSKNAKPPKKKIPFILKIFAGIGIVGGLIAFHKPIFEYIKGLFKKAPKTT